MADVDDTADSQAQEKLTNEDTGPATAPGPQVGTLDVDAIINKLLGFKNNPGKQVGKLIFYLYHTTQTI